VVHIAGNGACLIVQTPAGASRCRPKRGKENISAEGGITIESARTAGTGVLHIVNAITAVWRFGNGHAEVVRGLPDDAVLTLGPETNLTDGAEVKAHLPLEPGSTGWQTKDFFLQLDHRHWTIWPIVNPTHDEIALIRIMTVIAK